MGCVDKICSKKCLGPKTKIAAGILFGSRESKKRYPCTPYRGPTRLFSAAGKGAQLIGHGAHPPPLPPLFPKHTLRTQAHHRNTHTAAPAIAPVPQAAPVLAFAHVAPVPVTGTVCVYSCRCGSSKIYCGQYSILCVCCYCEQLACLPMLLIVR